jgi:hypothetical protein
MSVLSGSVSTSIPGITSTSTPNFPSGSLQTGGGSVTVNPTAGLGLASLAGVLVDVLAIVVVVAMVGVFVIIVVANRADPDPSGRRPQAVYCFAVAFVTVTTSIIGSAVVVDALLQLVGSHSGSITNSVARAALLGGLIAVVSMMLLVAHLRRGLVLARADAGAASPSRRVGQSYVSAVSFVAVVSLLATTVIALYLLFAIAWPGVFGTFGSRSSATRLLVVVAYLAVAASVVRWTHRDLLPPGPQTVQGAAGPTGSGGAAPASLPSLDLPASQ